jgi:preprotein translocase subunit SecG
VYFYMLVRGGRSCYTMLWVLVVVVVVVVVVVMKNEGSKERKGNTSTVSK